MAYFQLAKNEITDAEQRDKAPAGLDARNGIMKQFNVAHGLSAGVYDTETLGFESCGDRRGGGRGWRLAAEPGRDTDN